MEQAHRPAAAGLCHLCYRFEKFEFSTEGRNVRQVIVTDTAPKAIGPYSQAIRSAGLLFLAGQIPLDPATMQLVEGDIGKQTERVLENVKAILTAAGSSLDRVVKTTVFLKDMNEFAAMNEVYGRYFPQNPPARSTVEAARLPPAARVEIEGIAPAAILSEGVR